MMEEEGNAGGTYRHTTDVNLLDRVRNRAALLCDRLTEGVEVADYDRDGVDGLRLEVLRVREKLRTRKDA